MKNYIFYHKNGSGIITIKAYNKKEAIAELKSIVLVYADWDSEL